MKTVLPGPSMPLTTHGVQATDEAVHALVDRQTDAWNCNDAAGWARDFLEDANFINVRGDLVKGRAAIEKILAFIFRGPYKKSHCTVTIDSVGYPAADVCIVETTSEVTDFQGLPPGLVATAPGVLRTRFKLILVQRDGSWRIFAAQNTSIVPQAMPIQ
jgi:uncharacterized protein (TIGR02246 family)